MTIYLIGNDAYDGDDIPARFGGYLCTSFPDCRIETADPAENFLPEDNAVIIDAVQGITDVTVFRSLEDFQSGTHVTPHDYDLLLHLQLLQKLKKITRITIIGIPFGSATELTKPVLHDLLKHLIGPSGDREQGTGDRG